MTSKVAICNIALSHIGAFGISSLTESTKESIECNKFYDVSLLGTLEGHNWSFARKWQDLALRTDTNSRWDYVYALPSDCARTRYLSDGSYSSTGTSSDLDSDRFLNTGKIEFEIGVSSDLTQNVLMTNLADAELVYTAKVTTTNLFSAKFVEALAYKLAAYLAQPMKGSPQLATQMLNAYQLLLSDAEVNDANSDYKKEEAVNNFVSARI